MLAIHTMYPLYLVYFPTYNERSQLKVDLRLVCEKGTSTCLLD